MLYASISDNPIRTLAGAVSLEMVTALVNAQLPR
jgi:hypothetical protein